ncbi:hypothetical protein AB0H71_19750 [Nocardia sp. NPDC050697]|uniref:hypothetical protein n=1 Tax=Nocardia sp. NPDC050697 TaxID=3155158 RepID=UPI0033F396E1
MATRSAAPGVHSVTHWRAHARRHPLRHRLAVVAPDAADVIRHAGGWLFDRSAAGWEVTVLVADSADVAPLRILGATVLDLRQSISRQPTHDIWPMAVAVSAASYRAEPLLRDGLHDSLDRGLTEVAVWGDDLPAELADRVAPSYHRVSVAALAFKSCALAAAGCAGEPVLPTEVFGTGELLPPRYREGMRDLLPA